MSAMETNKVNNAQDDKDGTVAKSVPMTIAVSANVLFNMMEQKDSVIKPGVAFPFVKALVTVNAHLRELYPESEELFDIVLITDNHTQEEYLRDCLNKLGLSHISIHEEEYISKLHTKILYLTEDPEKAENAINNGHAAAIMFPNNKEDQWSDDGEAGGPSIARALALTQALAQLRVAFDGDGILFSDESEIVFKKEGFEAFMKNEKDKEDTPLREGPLKSFLEALGNVERKFRAKGKKCPVLTYLVTSRNPVIPGTRALKTLQTWDLEITQAFFLSGRPKGPPLKMIRPHIFFDDQKPHIDEACELGIISAHVPYGIGYETYKGAAKKPML
ncbi:hypothetical protein SKAU_G00286930 [Synaphobranchus kaupii]|uniref:Cytosolic 5'-nucleotidase 1A n=1 Tax=Synaphobranchus kaupii TaxID=118154 RepID=A0A9Q1EYA4_SYNKA|nr:hypothetical protein SKAU_G00286930 [Synaphobranchus kaupii]